MQNAKKKPFDLSERSSVRERQICDSFTVQCIWITYDEKLCSKGFSKETRCPVAEKPYMVARQYFFSICMFHAHLSTPGFTRTGHRKEIMNNSSEWPSKPINTLIFVDQFSMPCYIFISVFFSVAPYVYMF